MKDLHGDTAAHGVRLANPDDLEPLSRVLARAFHEDPIHSWLIPDSRRRLEAFRRMFAIFLQDAIPRRTVFTTAGLEGVALWADPDHARLSTASQLRLALHMMGALRAGIVRGMHYSQRVEARQPACRHWYLRFLGTDPAHQGRGIGSTLLSGMLRRCDHERLPIYLETVTLESVAFYARRGFVQRGEILLPKGPKVYPMLREPAGR